MGMVLCLFISFQEEEEEEEVIPPVPYRTRVPENYLPVVTGTVRVISPVIALVLYWG